MTALELASQATRLLVHAGVRCTWCFVSRTVRDGHVVASWAAEQRTDTPDERSRACDLSMARLRLLTWDGQAGAGESNFETPLDTLRT
jgi:hypothetical protein